LSGVSNDILFNCLFLQVLENQLLCDKSAVTATNDSVNNMRRISMMESEQGQKY
jgi:hypothetical protein